MKARVPRTVNHNTNHMLAVLTRPVSTRNPAPTMGSGISVNLAIYNVLWALP